MKKCIEVVSVLLVVFVFCSGCMSSMVLRDSKKKVALRKATLAGDDAAIKAIRMGNDGVGLGIDISNLEALSEQPLLQLGAAVLDAALCYGAYEAVKYVENGLDEKDTEKNHGNNVEINGNNNETEVNIIQGDGNDSNQDDEETTTTTN